MRSHPAPLRRAAPAVLLLGLALTPAACSTSCTGAPAPSPATAQPERAAEATPQTAPRGEREVDDLALDGDFRRVEVATVGWDRATSAPVVLLRELETGQLVPIWVGTAEARAIATALHEIDYPRPMTHDLMASLLDRLDATLEELLIHDLVNGTYYGLLRLTPRDDGGDPVLVDTRPSDGVALALRAGARIRVSQEILDTTPEVDFLAPDEPSQVARGLGLTVVAPNPALREEFGLPEGGGLVVIRAAGEAAEAGLRRGDLVLEVAGRSLDAPVDLLDALGEAPHGEPVTVRYWRDGDEDTVEVTPEVELEGAGPERTA